jgi:hypothetical protein
MRWTLGIRGTKLRCLKGKSRSSPLVNCRADPRPERLELLAKRERSPERLELPVKREGSPDLRLLEVLKPLLGVRLQVERVFVEGAEAVGEVADAEIVVSAAAQAVLMFPISKRTTRKCVPPLSQLPLSQVKCSSATGDQCGCT